MNYTFVWPGEAREVILAGSFLRNWQDRVRMEKKGNQWVFSTYLERAKHYYKFVVDGNWRCDDKAPQENDGQNNINNILDLTHMRVKPLCEIDENKDYYMGKPPPDHFDLNAQPVPIHFTKNILNSKSETKLSENNVHYQFSDNSENLSFKYFPPPPHVILKHASFFKTENQGVTVAATTERIMNKFISIVYYKPKMK